ncbi:MAG TPA: DUF2336 domain-containing protein [Candidatus Cybelea sp.]|nr:DUF2336 domain-containing protein [Candidatus Cybelea sp.]
MTQSLDLSAADVAKLIQDPSSERRAETAAKVATVYSATLSDSERAIATEIFHIMLQDAAVRVRKALSDNLKSNPDVPHDIAVSLAKDVAEVATPMLQSSTVLNDADLAEIVASHSATHQRAVAERESISPELAHSLVEHGDEEAVASLMKNEGAKLTEGALQRALDRFGESEKVHAPMVHRSKLPITVAERLVTLVSTMLCERLLTHHDLPPAVAADLVLQSRERATVSLSTDAAGHDVASLVEQLHRNARLTPTIVLRALCTGDLDFFENAMARLADVPVVNAYRLIHDPGKLGLQAIYQRCRMPDGLFPIVRAAVDVARELKYDGEADDRSRFTARTIERVLTHFETGFDGDNVDYLIDKLTRLAA